MSGTDVNASRSRMFELCLTVIEAEKSYNDDLVASVPAQKLASSLKLLIAAIQDVSVFLNNIDEFVLFQVPHVDACACVSVSVHVYITTSLLH